MRCSECGKEISEDEYVVNWSSCSQCFDKGYEEYMSLQLVQRIKAELEAKGVDLKGPCGAFQITKRVAWELRNDGAGLLYKNTGNNCMDFSVDYIIWRDGQQRDILKDAGGHTDENRVFHPGNDPRWDEPTTGDLSRWRPPVKDWVDDKPEPPTPTDPPSPPPSSNLEERLTAIEKKLERLDRLAMAVLHHLEDYVNA